MGFTPEQVGKMTIWEFNACVDGYGRSQGWKKSGGGKAMSLDRLKELGIE